MSREEPLRQRLLAGEQALLAAVAGLEDEMAATTSANPGWAIKDVLAHLASAELGHCAVIRRLLAGESTHLPGFDLDAFNEAEVAARRRLSLAEVLAEYQANRAVTLALLTTIGPEDWDKAGPHPGGFETTVEGVFRVIALHEKRHLREMKAAT
ncbi:MAG: DinB family protein [Caldilineales bacterium]|nr:DinB family protein [Caldilineales bacterium]